jgi:dihydroorotate dehydrogenase
VQSVRDASSIIQEGNLRLSIAAVGGVSKVQDATDFFEAGTGAVMLGSSPMYLPDLAAELHAAFR